LRDRYKAFRAKSLADVELLSLMLDAIYLVMARSGRGERSRTSDRMCRVLARG